MNREPSKLIQYGFPLLIGALFGALLGAVLLVVSTVAAICLLPSGHGNICPVTY